MYRPADLWQSAKRAVANVFSGKNPDDELDIGLDEEIDRSLSYDDNYDAAEYETTDMSMEGPRKVDQRVLNEVNDALREWHEASTYFEAVSDPDLVDFAIYDMEASRRKYMYLIKRTRSERHHTGGIDVVDGA